MKTVYKVLLTSLLGLIAVGGGSAAYVYTQYHKTPDINLNKLPIKQTTKLFDSKGVLLHQLHQEEHREYIKLSEISPHVLNAVIGIEDIRFYTHPGIDAEGIGRAAKVNLSEGGISEGASTITMQLARNLYLTNERSFERKFKEALIALKIEQTHTKDEILELYLNVVPFGHNTYGIKTAADTYFRKHPRDLNEAEAAMLAGIIKGPSVYSPFLNMERAKARQKLVLRAMAENNLIDAKKAQELGNAALKIAEKPSSFPTTLNPYVTNAGIIEAKQLLAKKMAEDDSIDVDLDKIYEEGLRIFFTIDKDVQDMAVASVKRGCINSRRRGARVENVAMLSIEPKTFHMKAIVGGCDPKTSGEYNRAFEAMRQPGSSFKSFVYYSAFARGYTPNHPINDSPVTYCRRCPKPYSPKNYGGSFAGPMNLRTALKTSRNIPAIKLGQQVSLDLVINDMRKMGITAPMDPNVISLPLGSKEISPYQMAVAYAVFASEGYFAEPSMILRIEDAEGNILVDNSKPEAKLVLNQKAVKMLTSVLQDVIRSGTGTRANIGRPAAGKTGTTESFGDAWFLGYTPDLSTAVWMGNDKATKKMGYGVAGGSYAAPIWRDFNVKYHQGKPVKNFK